MLGYDYTGYGASTGACHLLGAPASCRNHDRQFCLSQCAVFQDVAALRCRGFAWRRKHTLRCCTAGEPSVAATLADIQACYDCLRARFGKQPADIVLYGQSVGRSAYWQSWARCLLYAVRLSNIDIAEYQDADHELACSSLIRGCRSERAATFVVPGPQRTDWLPGGSGEGLGWCRPALTAHVRQACTLSEVNSDKCAVDGDLADDGFQWTCKCQLCCGM